MKRSNTTQKLATDRRKIAEELLVLNEKVGQVLLDFMHGKFKEFEAMQKNMPKNLPLRKMMDLDQYAKLLSSGYLINQQFKHMPPMSAVKEKQLIERLKFSLVKVKESMDKVSKNKTMQRIPYKSLYPFKATAMPNLYVESGECAWEADNVEKMYTQRQKAAKKFLAVLNKNKVFLDSVRAGQNASTFLILEQNIEFLKNLPPGPTNASEKERIEYLQLATTFVKNIFDMLNMAMKELNKILQEMKKNAIREHLAKK